MSRKVETLALGMTMALAFMCSPALAVTTTTINVGASQSLGNALVDLVGTFQAYYFENGISYNISVTIDSNENLKAAVINGGNGGAAPYDLILTDDGDLIKDLRTNYASYVQGPPFVFARDRLDLYSTSVDVSQFPAGLPPRFTGQLVIADPTSDAYGKASADLLAELPWFIKVIPSARVAVQPDVATVFAGVDLGMYPYGLLSKSSICKNMDGTENYPSGSYHHEYPPLHGARYHAIDPAGQATALATRTAAQSRELEDFAAFLTGAGTTQGTDVLLRYCYTLPPR